MKTKLALVFLVVALTIGFSTQGVAQDNEDGAINLSVSKTMKIDISPNTLNYTGVSPGNYQSTTWNNYNGVEIENKGSQNISTIWVESTEPDTRPFGTGAAGAYDAGNFIQLKTTGEAETQGAPAAGFHYAGRREYNESNELSYVNTDSGTEVRYGRFRTGNSTFFWAINQSGTSGTSGNGCAGGGGDGSFLMVGNEPHSKDTLGSTDFTDATTFTDYNISSGPNSVGRVNQVNFDTYEGSKQYSVFTWCGGLQNSGNNDTFIAVRRYDRQQVFNSGSDYSTSTSSLENLLTGTVGGTDALTPGEHFTVKTRISVPFGVAEGSIGQGTLTVYASQ